MPDLNPCAMLVDVEVADDLVYHLVGVVIQAMDKQEVELAHGPEGCAQQVTVDRVNLLLLELR